MGSLSGVLQSGISEAVKPCKKNVEELKIEVIHWFFVAITTMANILNITSRGIVSPSQQLTILQLEVVYLLDW